MSSCCWYLSAALILIPATTSAQTADDVKFAQRQADMTMREAMQCTRMAATVYAQLSSETARSASMLAHRKCKDEWVKSTYANAYSAASELASVTGKTISKAEARASIDWNRIYPEASIEQTEEQIADLRAMALLKGDSVYAEQRKAFEVRPLVGNE